VKEVSETKKAVEQAEKDVKKSGESRLKRILNWFRNLPKRIAKPFRNMYYELKKVTWPSKEKLIAYSIIVLVFMLFMGIVIGLLDMGASALVRLLIA
jgi:preprotein translocase, SecE subunit, bacterial